ncbi:guanylate kinase [Patescibacteria group bacterium]|nr:MAG: guanylate kinase [Patescibacteria group bacterium]
MTTPKKIIVIAGPTGSGESTLTRMLLTRYPRMRRLVTATTRPPRAKEQSGHDYYFFSKSQFQNELELGNILEHTYVQNRDTYYGTYKIDLDAKLNAGYIVIVNPDLVGAQYYKKNYGATTIFVIPSSLEELQHRLENRDGSLSAEELAKRLANAQHEIEQEGPLYDYRVLNKDGKMDQALEEIIEILKQAGYELD